jgi:hypothetical protein
MKGTEDKTGRKRTENAFLSTGPYCSQEHDYLHKARALTCLLPTTQNRKISLFHYCSLEHDLVRQGLSLRVVLGR